MAEEVSEVEKRPAEHLARLTAERRRQTRIRTVLGGGVFVLFLIFALTIMQQFRNFDSDRLEVKMNARASASLWPIVSEELDELTPKALPTLDAAFLADSSRFLPELTRQLLAENDRFLEDVEQQGDRLLNEAMATAFEERSREVKAFEALLHEDEEVSEQLMSAIMERAQGWARAELDHVMQANESVLQRLYDQAKILEEVEPDTELLDDLLMNLIEIANQNSETRR